MGIRIVHFCEIIFELSEQLEHSLDVITGRGYRLVICVGNEHYQWVIRINSDDVGCLLALPIIIWLLRVVISQGFDAFGKCPVVWLK
jgi:hypothetical protein